MKQGTFTIIRTVLFPVVILLSMVACPTVSENTRKPTPSLLKSQRQELNRALVLVKMGEEKAALKTLEPLVASNPVTRQSVKGVLLSAKILANLRDFKGAYELLLSFEKRARFDNLDLSRIIKARRNFESYLASDDGEMVHDFSYLEPIDTDQSSQNFAIESRYVSNAIGVVLPLTGNFGIYGQRVLTAMRLALGHSEIRSYEGAIIFNGPEGISLIVMDSKADPSTAKDAVNKLVDNYNVGVVVGDILSDTALQVASQSNERGIININLSRIDEITQQGPLVFRIGLTAKKQIAALFSIGPEEMVAKRYGILYPESHFGREMKDAFVDEARLRGVQITKIEGYSPRETTFTSHVRNMVGPRATSQNEAYEECSERAARIRDINARKKANRDCLDLVPPQIEFEALFIPDFPKRLNYIIPSFIAEGVMVSQNAEMLDAYRRISHSKDLQAVQLIGPNSWNSPLVGQRLKEQVDGALFVDNAEFLADRSDVALFVQGFKEAMLSGPSLNEAFAFDTIKILTNIFAQIGEDHFVDIAFINQSLKALEYDGLSGSLSFDENRESVLPFRLFSFRDGKIQPHTYAEGSMDDKNTGNY